MKKMVAAFDGLKYSVATRDYAIALAKTTGMYLAGFFMDDPLYNSFSIYDLVVNKHSDEHLLDQYKKQDDGLRQASALNFETNCIREGIAYGVHRDHNIASQQILRESIYTDLLLISKTETLTRLKESVPTRFIRDLLEDTQCPVLLLPEKYNPVQYIVLLYDGAPSSLYAIKMFNYLLPELAVLPTEIVSVKGNDALEDTDNKLMTEFLARHYPAAKRTILEGDPEKALAQHLTRQPAGTLAVLGAYRRGTVSRWFRQSMADVLMADTSLPLFIAHK